MIIFYIYIYTFIFIYIHIYIIYIMFMQRKHIRICKYTTVYIYINAFVNLALKQYFDKKLFTNQEMFIF